MEQFTFNIRKSNRIYTVQIPVLKKYKYSVPVLERKVSTVYDYYDHNKRHLSSVIARYLRYLGLAKLSACCIECFKKPKL